MDSTFNKLLENLSFQVVAGPCNQNVLDDITPKSIGTPVNVKVKFRHKDDVHRGVISVPKFENVRMSQNLRLINSDQTIISFDCLMDTKSSEKPAKKSQKKVFHIFKPGICLGSKKNDDDDGYPYVPPIIENVNTTFSATKVNLMNNEQSYSLKKNTIRQPFDDTNRTPIMFLGKCKPGGCLDPPFGEERYAYEPILVKDDIVKYQIKDDVENSQVSDRSYNTQLRSRSPLKDKERNVESKLYDELLITYPSSLNCKEVSNNKEILRAINTIEKTSISSAETRIQSFYKPPRSKETSISSNMEQNDIQRIIDNEIRIKPNYTIATNLKSPSKDSIYKQTGCPAEPVLPITVNLSPIESDLTSLQNNLECEIEQMKEYLEEQNISKFETGAEVKQPFQGVLENYSEYPNALPLLNNSVEKNSLNVNIRLLSDDIKPSPEIFESVKNNKTKLVNEAQINTKQEDEKSIIVIAPVRDLEETLTNDVDGEYLTEFNDENQTDRSSIEFRENYSDTQYFNKKNDVVDIFESQVFQTDLQNQSSSILQEHLSYVSNNGTNVNKNQMFNSSYIDHKTEIKSDYTNSKSNLASQSNIKNIFLGSTQVSSLSTVISKNNVSNLEDFKNNNDGYRSEESSNLNIFVKVSKTDNIESNLNENTLPNKDAEKRSVTSEEAKGNIDSVKNIKKPLKPNQESFQNISLTSSRHSLAELIIEKKPSDRLNSTIQITTSQILPVSPNVVVNSPHVTPQESQKTYNSDSQNNDNFALRSTTQEILNIKYLEDTNTMTSKISNLSYSKTESSKDEMTAISHESTSVPLPEQSFSEVISDKHSSNIEVDKIETDMNYFRNSNITQDCIQSNENIQISTHVTSKTLENPVNRDSLGQLNYNETGKDRLSEKNMETPETFKTELGQEVQTKISLQYDTQSDMKFDNFETFIKPELSNIILKEYTGVVNDLREMSNLNINSNENINSQLPNANNDKTDIEIKKDENKLFPIKVESKHLEVNIRSKDHLKLLRNNSNKEVTKSDVIELHFALQSYVNNNKERSFKTTDPALASENNVQESVLLFKSKLRVNKDEMKLPIDPYTNFVILVKRNKHINTGDAKNKHSQDALEENIYAGVPNEFQETMSMIYEQTLIPVQNMLKALKEEVDSLVRNQILIREMLTDKSKPTRLINVNRRCACYRK